MGNIQKNFISPYKPNQTAGAPIHNPVKASGHLTFQDGLFQCFVKKRIGSHNIQVWVLQTSNVGHLNKILRNKTLKLLGSYSAANGK
jgi:hypothetical protein